MRQLATPVLASLAGALACAMLAAAPAAAADISTIAPSAGARADPLSGARAAIERKDWNAAATQLEDAVRRDPKNADAHNLLGYALRNRGDYDRSLREYEEALRLDPRHRGAHEYLGELYVRMNKPEEARKHLAALEQLCGRGCEEYRDLAEDIEKAGKR